MLHYFYSTYHLYTIHNINRFPLSDSTYVLDLHRRFSGLYHSGHLKIEVFSFAETALTLMSVLYLRIVGIDSAGKLEFSFITLS